MQGIRKILPEGKSHIKMGPELIQMLTLAEKEIKIVITVFYVFQKSRRDMNDIKKTQTELLWIKTTIPEIKMH